ncbi:MAG: hypothetical protein COB77_02925 [Gammaproteobacteria bacterium]|nr:MAG: hypothetical protein COB77_02925 [Gammaproteobacteria bacterium]
MAVEIERKFLLKNDNWKSLVTKTLVIKQAYLLSGVGTTDKSSIRIRISDDKANINIKGTIIRQEYEYDIPINDAEQMITSLCEQVIIIKTRYHVPFESHLWEIDVFHGCNTGLQVEEVELDNVDEIIVKPDWIGEEVSHDKRYYNKGLS